MSKKTNNRALAVSQKVYGWLLRAYPPAHREEYGPAMAQLFRDQGRDAWSESRGWGMIKLWLRVLPDLVNTSITERLAALNPRKSMSDKMTALFRPLTSSLTVFFSIFALVFLLVLLVSVVVTFILPESYASTARIKVGPDEPVQGATAYDPYFIQTTFEIIQSQLVLEPAIKALDLNTKWGKKYFNGETLKTTESLEILKQRLQLAPVRNTMLLAITVYSDDKNEAAQIANAIAACYRDYRFKSLQERLQSSLKTMQEAYQEQEYKIQQVQADLDKLPQLAITGNEVATSLSPEEKLYRDKKRNLDQMLDAHKMLFAKLEAGKLELEMPKLTLVQITDTAEPGRAPVKPNKPLNIFIGAVAGGFLGLVAGAASAFVSFKSGNHGRKDVASA
jgi:capsular polysaccharide biosynthesis protein